MSKNAKRYPRSYWMGVGLSIGVAIGVALGPLFDSIGIGIAVGIATGSGIGASLEQKYKEDIRPPAEQENKRQRWAVIVGLLVMLAIAIGIVLLLVSRIK